MNLLVRLRRGRPFPFISASRPRARLSIPRIYTPDGAEFAHTHTRARFNPLQEHQYRTSRYKTPLRGDTHTHTRKGDFPSHPTKILRINIWCANSCNLARVALRWTTEEREGDIQLCPSLTLRELPGHYKRPGWSSSSSPRCYCSYLSPGDLQFLYTHFFFSLSLLPFHVAFIARQNTC